MSRLVLSCLSCDYSLLDFQWLRIVQRRLDEFEVLEAVLLAFMPLRRHGDRLAVTVLDPEPVPVLRLVDLDRADLGSVLLGVLLLGLAAGQFGVRGQQTGDDDERNQADE